MACPHCGTPTVQSIQAASKQKEIKRPYRFGGGTCIVALAGFLIVFMTDSGSNPTLSGILCIFYLGLFLGGLGAMLYAKARSRWGLP
ncbi:MAG: hypothetical protein ABSA67_05425 [Candidatus Brocadiia bacterium]|jgi:drug/metabolite transporter (DMT)-like permease